jgi:hypothetical protein
LIEPFIVLVVKLDSSDIIVAKYGHVFVSRPFASLFFDGAKERFPIFVSAVFSTFLPFKIDPQEELEKSIFLIAFC